TISLGSKTRVAALILVSSLDPTDSFDRDDGVFAEIYRVDGSDYRSGYWYYGGDHLGNNGDDANLRQPFYFGDAQTIDFRLRNTDNCVAWALAVVFPQSAP